MVDKFANDASSALLLPNLVQVTESISGSVVPLAMFIWYYGLIVCWYYGIILFWYLVLCHFVLLFGIMLLWYYVLETTEDIRRILLCNTNFQQTDSSLFGVISIIIIIVIIIIMGNFCSEMVANLFKLMQSLPQQCPIPQIEQSRNK